jgi:signal transduction histidine kinase
VLKAAAFIMAVALSVTAVIGLDWTFQRQVWDYYWTADDVGQSDYTQTERYRWYVQSVHSYLGELVRAVTGKTPEQVTAEIESLFWEKEWQLTMHMTDEYRHNIHFSELWAKFVAHYEWEDEVYEAYSIYDENYTRMEHFNDIIDIIRDEMEENYRNSLTTEQLRERFDSEYAEAIRHIRENHGRIPPEHILERINELDGVVYYVQVGKTVFRNTERDYSQIRDEFFHPHNAELYIDSESDEYIFGITEDYITLQNQRLAQMNNRVREIIIFAGIWVVLFALSLFWLIKTAGRKANAPGVTLNAVDSLFTEFLLIIFAGTGAACVLWTVEAYELSGNTILIYVYIGILTICFTLAYTMFLSIVRHIKKRTFFKNALIYKIFANSHKGVSTLYSKSNPMFKTSTVVISLGILTMIPYIGFITVPLALHLLYLQVNEFKKLKSGIKSVRNGVYDEKIVINPSGFRGESEFTALAADVNEIAVGLSEEVERRTKSERLKTELIVNVSHDIRTPLTSLITYADLLMKEDTDNDNIKKYAEIISAKSERLKTLTDDLFESAKASSGNISVNFESVDINALLIQALAEFDEKIKTSSLEFKLSLPEETVTAYADGKLMWRVAENLINNALNYSLEGSRVYIDVSQDDKDVLIKVKNISKAELNISEDEVTERFKRGDLSRNSEGSGLGLDIASSLMLCQNGLLGVRIDGDLFKVSIKVPKTLKV